MQDRKGNELNVGDYVFFGEKANNQGSRGECKVGKILEIARYIQVEGSWSRLTGGSVIKCTEKFAEMYKNESIFQI